MNELCASALAWVESITVTDLPTTILCWKCFVAVQLVSTYTFLADVFVG